MSPESFALAVAVVMFVGGLLGLVLQRALPEHHTTGSSRDMIGAIVGLLTLLCALPNENAVTREQERPSLARLQP